MIINQLNHLHLLLIKYFYIRYLEYVEHVILMNVQMLYFGIVLMAFINYHLKSLVFLIIYDFVYLEIINNLESID